MSNKITANNVQEVKHYFVARKYFLGPNGHRLSLEDFAAKKQPKRFFGYTIMHSDGTIAPMDWNAIYEYRKSTPATSSRSIEEEYQKARHIAHKKDASRVQAYQHADNLHKTYLKSVKHAEDCYKQMVKAHECSYDMNTQNACAEAFHTADCEAQSAYEKYCFAVSSAQEAYTKANEADNHANSIFMKMNSDHEYLLAQERLDKFQAEEDVINAQQDDAYAQQDDAYAQQEEEAEAYAYADAAIEADEIALTESLAEAVVARARGVLEEADAVVAPNTSVCTNRFLKLLGILW
jgi:hypothetical protein